MKLWWVFQPLLIIIVHAAADSQIRSSVIEKLPLESTRQWTQPQFSPDGKLIYYTTLNFDGLWEYSISARAARPITDDPHSGFGFAISQDGNQLAYRRTSVDGGSKARLQEIVIVDLKHGSSSVVTTGTDISTPVFIQNSVSYSTAALQKMPAQLPVSTIAILGIDETKIAMYRGGQRVLWDPLGGGSYIWPSLSPDGQKIVAYEMVKGTFVCDPEGKNIVFLGRRDAPSWTRSGKWIVFMDDKDDGHRIVSSDIYAISPNGGEQVQLTDTPNAIEMYPACSPAEDKIVCSSADGSLYLISYTETPR